ncbi:MAG: RNA polymerase sigma factor [Oscillospiraceae bacterium]|nr:RNA polymerase sigma factor [Oscillospiraceae bacterium]
MDAATFERLYAECFSALQRFCYFKLPSKADGDDVLQNVALAAWSHREAVWSQEAFKPWVLKIATNKIRDFYRKHAKQLDFPWDEVTELSLSSSQFWHDR